jgi:hypothetical protein
MDEITGKLGENIIYLESDSWPGIGRATRLTENQERREQRERCRSTLYPESERSAVTLVMPSDDVAFLR